MPSLNIRITYVADALLAILLLFPLATWSEDQMDPEVLLQHVYTTYRGLKTYADQGHVRFYADQMLVDRITFYTRYKRDYKFFQRLDYTTKSFREPGIRVTWGDEHRGRIYEKRGKETYSERANVWSALGDGTYGSRAETVLVSGLLSGRTLYQSRAIHELLGYNRRDLAVEVDARSEPGFYVYKLRCADVICEEVWIEKSSYLVKKYISRTGHSQREVDFDDVKINEPMDDKVFDFEPMRIRRALAPVLEPIGKAFVMAWIAVYCSLNECSFH